jgi:hypothetical protein
MEFFNRLGDRVQRAWRARNFDEPCFHEVATAEMSALRPSDHLTKEQILDWLLDAEGIPPQGDLANTFGSPALRVYVHERFYIEVLFWVDATTSIHQHGFSGAFHVLEGSSLQSEFAFRPEHRYSDRLLVGRLDLKVVEHLRKGDVRSIRTSDGLIHSLFHLDRPSVSVVVRTPKDPKAGPQYEYTRDGIAFDPFFTTDLLKRQEQSLEFLRSVEHPSFLDQARRAIEQADAYTMFRLMSWMRKAMPDETYARLLAEIRSPHDVLLERLSRDRDEMLRERAIVYRRSRIHGKDHRFLLALLLNLPNRDRILETVRNAYPGAPPAETVRRWISELADVRLEDGENALNVEMDESSQRIFAHLLEGASDAQVVARLREEYADVDDQVDGIFEMCAAFRTSLLFRTLLAAA